MDGGVDGMVADKEKGLRLIWLDLEMTGLSVATDRIIEIATVVTDAELNELAVGPELVIRQDGALLDAMDDWNTRQHGRSGLLDAVRASDVDERSAELQTLAFLRRHAHKGQVPLCGNTIHHDRRFLARHMPELEDFFHYRNVDVSSLRELARRWRPELVRRRPGQRSGHRALADVRDSISELEHYRDHFLRVEASTPS